MQFQDLLQKLLVLDSVALSANIEALIADENACQDLVETRGAGAQSLVNLLHAVRLRLVRLSIIEMSVHIASGLSYGLRA